MNVFKRETLLILFVYGVLILDFRTASAANLDIGTARTAFKAKEYAKVIEQISPHLDVASKEAFLLLAKSYSGTDNAIMAQKTLNVGLAKFKDDREMGAELGKVLLTLNKEREAKATLKEVIEKNPTYEAAYLVMADIYEKRKNRYELRLLYQDLVEKLGEKPVYVTKLCDLSVKDGLYDLAFKYCESGIRLDQKNPDNYVNMGSAYKETGQSTKANAYFKKAADSFSKSEFAQSSYAVFLDESKNYSQSFPYWKRASEADATSVRAWAGLAHSALEIQKFADSYAAFEKLCLIEKTAERTLRQAVGSLKTMNQTAWMEKFTDLVSKCSQVPDGRGRL